MSHRKKHKKHGGVETPRAPNPLKSRAMALMHQYKQAGVEHPLTQGWIQARREAGMAIRTSRRGGCGTADPQHQRCAKRMAGAETEGYFSGDEDRYVEVSLPVIEESSPRAGGRRRPCRAKSGKYKKCPRRGGKDEEDVDSDEDEDYLPVEAAPRAGGAKRRKCKKGKTKRCCSKYRKRKGGAEEVPETPALALNVSADDEETEEDVEPRAGGRRRPRRRRSHSRSRSRSRSPSGRYRSVSMRMGGAEVLRQVRERAQELRAKAQRSGGSLTWNESLSLAGAEHRARSASL